MYHSSIFILLGKEFLLLYMIKENKNQICNVNFAEEMLIHG